VARTDGWGASPLEADPAAQARALAPAGGGDLAWGSASSASGWRRANGFCRQRWASDRAASPKSMGRWGRAGAAARVAAKVAGSRLRARPCLLPAGEAAIEALEALIGGADR